MSFGRSRARMVAGDKPQVTFADVAGVDEAKQELGEIVVNMQEPTFMTSLDTTIQLLSTHSGRDKVAKTFHYASRILIWHFQNRGKPERADQVEQFRQAIGNSRRVGRFFSYINSIPSIWQLAFPDPRTKDRQSSLFRFLLLVANVSDMLYYVSDNLTYAAKYNFIKLSPKTNYFWEELIGSWTWFVSMVIYIAHDINTHLRLRNQRQRLEQQARKDSSAGKASTLALAATDEDLFNNKLSLVKNLADMQLAIYFCFPNSTWPSHWIGFFGVLNAIVGGFQAWRGFYKAS